MDYNRFKISQILWILRNAKIKCEILDRLKLQ